MQQPFSNSEPVIESDFNSQMPEQVASKPLPWLKYTIVALVALLLVASSLYVGFELGKNNQTYEGSEIYHEPLDLGPEIDILPESPTNTTTLFQSTDRLYSFSYPSYFQVTEEKDRVVLSQTAESDPSCSPGGCFLGVPSSRIEIVRHKTSASGLSLKDFAENDRITALAINSDQGELLSLPEYDFPVVFYEAVGARYTHNYFVLLNNTDILQLSFLFASSDENSPEILVAKSIMDSLRVL
jgi:hypothetical protein